MRRGLSVALASAAFLPVAVGLVPACNDAKTHVYSARAYDTASDCLSDYAALDVVPGETGAATCAPVCLVSGGTYYASRMCAPYPSAFDAFTADASVDAAVDPTCQAAIAALVADKSCGAPADGGDDGGGEAGDDGGGEAGDDGGGEAGDDGGGDAGDEGG